jgi:hypothetical protein
MAAYLQFVLNRGTSADTRILATSSIQRMETPRSTWAARRGLKTGYGLTTAALIREGFVWHGHSGEINGGLSELWYVPEHGIGYFTSINSDNGFDSFRIGQVIRQYLTRGLPQPAVPMLAALPADAPNYQGWYEPASPRMQLFHFVQRITDLGVVRVEDGTLSIRSAAGMRRYVPVGDRQFRRTFDSGPQDPVATLILLDTDDGRFIQIGTETSVMRRVPAWVVMLELTTIAYVLLSVLAVLLYAPFWVIGGLRQTSSRPRERMLRAWPLISVVSLVTAALLLGAASDDPITNLGTPTVWSVGLWITTFCFLGSVIASVVALWLTPSHTVRSSLGRFTIGATAALVLACGYLAYWGVIGLRTWA